MAKRLRKNRGFTLIELMIVIVITAFLVIIAIGLLKKEVKNPEARIEEPMKKEAPKSDTRDDQPKYKPL